jgi:deoxyribose-phosphate aldolase
MDTKQRKYRKRISDRFVRSLKESAVSVAGSYNDPDRLKIILSLLDMTTLHTTDAEKKIRSLCEKVNQLTHRFPEIPNVAALCVYPSLVPTVREALTAPDVKIASVAGGFPSSQTFLKIKLAEIEMAITSGAEEIDVVISVGKFLESNLPAVEKELKEIRRVVQKNCLKIILETGALSSPDNIYRASMLAMESGADFIKTSTGKYQPAATIEAVGVMCTAIGDYYSATGKRVGIKPAGGISASSEALPFLAIVVNTLGTDWITPSLFRFGASRLANHLLSDIESFRRGRKEEISFF